MIDPGLVTDSTGEGMAGAIDVSLETQKALAKAANRSANPYNGIDALYDNKAAVCMKCGTDISKYDSRTRGTCYSCHNRSLKSRVMNGMV